MEKSFENLEDGFVCLSISDAGLQLPLAGGNVTAAPVHNAMEDNDALKSHPQGSPVFEKLNKHCKLISCLSSVARLTSCKTQQTHPALTPDGSWPKPSELRTLVLQLFPAETGS